MANTEHNETDWLTVPEAAKRLGVSGMTITRWIDAGYFPGTIRLSPQPRSEYRIPLDAIKQFEESRKVK